MTSLKDLQKAYLQMLKATENYNRALASASASIRKEFEPWMVKQVERELEKQGVKVDESGRPKKFNFPPPSPSSPPEV